MNLVIAGGGTGGHIFAGVAIAQEFTSRSMANRVHFIGSEYGLEKRLVPKSGFELTTIKVGKLVGQGFSQKLTTLFQIPVAIFKCMQELRRFKAEMVIGVGGYAAGPCIIAAKLLGISIGVLEQNAVLGFTNRISAKLATHVFTAFDSIPDGVRASKVTYTGNPTRSNLKPVHDKLHTVVFVFGGSQGSNAINKLIVEAATVLKDKGITLIHQTGEKDFDWVLRSYQMMDYKAHVHKFIDDMQSMYNQASLVICRAGSGTISELGATENAAVFIPLPTAAGNHQYHNAKKVEAAGAGLVFEQPREGKPSNATELARMILDALENPVRLIEMRKNISRFFKPDSVRKIVDIMTLYTYAQKK